MIIKILNILFTFIAVDTAWIFFAAPDFRDACRIILQMFSAFKVTKLTELGLSDINWYLLLIALLILLIVDLLHESGKSIFVIVSKQKIWVRWGVYLGLIWCIILFGIYGVGYDTSQFIYFQF